MKNSYSEIMVYKNDAGDVQVNAILTDNTLWLTQKQIAQVFDVGVPAINKHIANIIETGELSDNSVISKMEITAGDGKNYNTAVYNLDMIIAVGYRVNSIKATDFRIWATRILHEYIQKGFALNDERFKQANRFDREYFKELRERIRDIRVSERMLYQQIKDIYALSADYNANNAQTLLFFANVQNKVHFAITGQTAAEVIYKRVDNKKQNIGLTSWKNSPNGKILRGDVSLAKNYLSAPELKELRYIVSLFLDYAEHQAESEQLIFMRDWEKLLNDFLKFNKKLVLADNGKISHEMAIEKAYNEYDKYKKQLKLTEKSDSVAELTADLQVLENIEDKLKK
jgi:hypothetical protein